MLKRIILAACVILMAGSGHALAQSAIYSSDQVPAHNTNEAMLVFALKSLGYDPELELRIDAGTRHVFIYSDSTGEPWKMVIERTSDNYIRLRTTVTAIGLTPEAIAPGVAAKFASFPTQAEAAAKASGEFIRAATTTETALSTIETDGKGAFTLVTPVKNAGLSAAHLREALIKHSVIARKSFIPLIQEAAKTAKAKA